MVLRRKKLSGIAGVLLLTAILLSGDAFAGGSVSFDIQPRLVKVGESAACTFTVRGIDNPSPPALPQIDGLNFNGPSVQKNFSMVNGRIDNYLAYQYRVVPIREGTFTVGPFRYQAGNQAVDIPAIEIKALPPTGDIPQNAQNQEDWIFARLTAGKTTVYNQETFEIFLSVYSAQGLEVGSGMSLHNMPEAGLSLQNFQELRGDRAAVNGRIYQVKRFRAYARGLTEGTFTLSPVVRTSLLIPRKSRGRPTSIFGDFFGRVDKQPVDLDVEPLEITVVPVPEEGKPESFAGAVGRFMFDVDVKPRELTVGDPVTVTIRVSGQGNLDSVSSPELTADDTFKLYESRLISRNLNEAGTAGEKTFEQVLIPQSEDATPIPALLFSFFDPEKASYQTITRGPFDLTLKTSKDGQARIMQSSPTKVGPSRILGTDIVYLKTGPSSWADLLRPPLYQGLPFWLFQAVPLLAVSAVFLVSRRQRQFETDVAFARRHKAPRAARDGVRAAERALREHDTQQVYESIWSALASYFGNKMNLSPGEVTDQGVLDAVDRAGMPEAVRDSLKGLLTTCSAMRFAGEDSPEKVQLESDLRELQRLLRVSEKLKI